MNKNKKGFEINEKNILKEVKKIQKKELKKAKDFQKKHYEVIKGSGGVTYIPKENN